MDFRRLIKAMPPNLGGFRGMGRGAALLVLVLALIVAPELRAAPAAPENALSSGGAPLRVTAAPILALAFHPQGEAPAVAISLNDSLLSPEIAGIVGEIGAEVGERVAAGAVLARLDDWPQRLALEQAQADRDRLLSELQLARRLWSRAKELTRQDHASREALERRETEQTSLAAALRRQEAMVEEARLRLDKTRIQAPFAGIVAERMAQVGAWIAPGTPLFRLVDPARVEVSARFRPEEAEEASRGEGLRFVAVGGEHPVTLRALSALLDERSRTREGRFRFTAHLAPPGSAGVLRWTRAEPHLPSNLLVRRDGGLGVFVVDQGKARFLPLPEAREGRPVPLPEGVRAAQVVVAGREGLQEGAPLAVEPLPAHSGEAIPPEIREKKN
ncbi:MAG: efflux RND transporter periplasmic adaptor subunit [Magnetococcales bacterium]|nr:efflux RND transporter periplasmic adaptor subunit [Magnetococcales bacterium]